MLLDVSELLKKKILKLPFKVMYNGGTITRDEFKLTLLSPLEITGDAYYDGEIVNVKGDIVVSIKAQCSRCLENFSYLHTVDFDEEFSKSQDEEFYTFTGNTIDLQDMVIDNLILSMPYKFICKDDCKGLCPVCGKNLNKEHCDCEKNEVDPRLAKLRDLFKAD